MKVVPQVDDSDSFLEFPGSSDPQKARFHVMDCLVCIHQIPTLGSHRQIRQGFVEVPTWLRCTKGRGPQHASHVLSHEQGLSPQDMNLSY